MTPDDLLTLKMVFTKNTEQNALLISPNSFFVEFKAKNQFGRNHASYIKYFIKKNDMNKSDFLPAI